MAKYGKAKNYQKQRKLTFTVLGRNLLEFFRTEEAKPVVSSKYV